MIRDGVTFRLYRTGAGDGAWNMAFDEAMLLRAREGEASIRVYRWERPTISTGRFQDPSRALDRDRLDREAVPFVRRPTGGRAVLHGNDLTYSIAFAPAHLAKPADYVRRRVYFFVGACLQAGLARLGVPVDLHEGRPAGSSPACFATTSEYEATSRGRKLAGSAMNITPSGVLQHGSVPLDETPALLYAILRCPPASHAHLRGELGREVSFEEAEAAVVAGFSFFLRLQNADPDPGFLATVGRLREEKYASPEWNLHGRVSACAAALPV